MKTEHLLLAIALLFPLASKIWQWIELNAWEWLAVLIAGAGALAGGTLIYFNS